MITKLKLEKSLPSSNKFYGTTYYTEDITEQMAVPFVDCERLDEVLDTSQVILYNNDPDPIKPFTRFIITITDTEEDGSTNDNYTYRYSESDTVTNVTMGNEPIYKHTLNLIEITKILERVPVDNLCFTNYLDDKYGSENEIDYTFEKSGSGVYGIFEADAIDYTSTNRIRGPYQFVGTTINPAIGLKVRAKTSHISPIAGLIPGTYHYDVPMTEYYVIAPSGKTYNLNGVDSFTYDEIGTYTFKQRYYKNKTKYYVWYLAIEKADCWATWKVKVVDEETPLPTRYSIEEVIDRLLRVHALRRSGVDTRRFKLDDNLRDYLGSIQSPEFSFTQSTLMDALTQIGGYIHAIPKLVPSVLTTGVYDEKGEYIGDKINNYNSWDTISFTFLGGSDKFNEDNYSLYDASFSADDYTRNFITNVQNATQTNYVSNVSVVEPFINGYISTRTENANFRVTNDDAIVKLSHPIQSILQVFVIDNNGIKHDITSCVKESASYNLLPAYTNKNSYSSKTKNYALQYKKGDNKITALSYTTPTEVFVEAFTNDEAIRTILKARTNGVQDNIRDISFQVKYIPIRNFKFKHYKSIIQNEAEELSLYYNQQSNAVDIESYGENIKGALMKTGNVTVAETQYFDNYADAPKKGQVSSDNYYAFAVNKEISVGVPVKVTTQWSKDFNKMNDFVGVKKTVRQYEISEEESIERNVDYQEFCVVSNELDIQDQYDIDDEELKQIISNRLDVLGFPTSKFLHQLKAKLSNDSTTEYKAISYVIVKTITSNSIPEKNAVEIVERDPNAPEGYVPCRFYDQSNNLLAVIYADPEGWNTVQFDGETDEGYYTDITGIEGSGVYLGDCDMSAVYNRNFEIEGATLIGWEVRSQDNVVEGMVETSQILIDGEKNLFPIYEYHDELTRQFLLPVSCFPCGNSIVLYFKATDNYGASTYVEDVGAGQGVEKYIEYANEFGRFTNMELVFGSDNPIPSGFSGASIIKSNSKKLYLFNSSINEDDVLVDFRDNAFVVEKDSREAISFTGQLNFISNKENIFIGKGLAHSMSIVGDTTTNYRFVAFTQKPSKFNSDISENTFIAQAMPAISLNVDTRSICYESVEILTNCVGYGIIDANNRLCIYVDGDLKAGDKTKPIYLQFRGSI